MNLMSSPSPLWIARALGEARRKLLKDALTALALTVAIIIGLIFSMHRAHAQGWDWFIKHVHPTGDCGFEHEIIGSFYWHGKRTASGARFNPHGISAAHRHLPFGTLVTIRNPKNGRSLTVPVNDRGPYIRGVASDGAIDLSLGAARALGMTQSQFVCASW